MLKFHWLSSFKYQEKNPSSSSTLSYCCQSKLRNRRMTRRKIQIKKIEDTASRQVTFSKRRRGLFKKAQELSTLCDAEIALMVFSTTDRLFQFSTSSMQDLIQRYCLQTGNLEKLDQPSLEQQIEGSNYTMLSKEFEEKTLEVRRLNGEELQGLKFKELQKLEDLLESRLNRVSRVKNERIHKEISALKKQGAQLLQENKQLKQLQRHRHKQGQPFDTTLKLGLLVPEQNQSFSMTRGSTS
ncbi:hypothetical protein L6164_036394 [Bauhinia variegata]|uniref:Uncharacterized protein n=1 Tax=Bauhinia variegata TaxID=167791 RepID=A0ACB9KH37_BAUVA|nr:hypothetical protein L6164_036394 [Bauhinia variegata]